MKNIKYLYRLLPVMAVLCLNACSDDDNEDSGAIVETMELTASATEIELDINKPNEVALTFEWTKAREMPEDYIVSYLTKLDIEGNNFNACVRTEEEDGVFTKSYTTDELQKLLTEKWGQSVNKPSTIQFRVIGRWDGGSKYAMPEVRTISVDIQPYIPIVFNADKVYLEGSAIDGEKITMTKTVENKFLYAWMGELKAGELKIPVEFEGETNYVCSSDNGGEIQDGEDDAVTIRPEPIAWQIPKDGEYRVWVNMEKKTVTIFSPDKKLEPAVVTWLLDGETQTTEVTNIWHYGEPTGWGWKTGNWSVSIADPQVLVYSGTAISGRTKFGVYPHNQCYVYTGNNTATNTTVTHGVAYDLFEGYSSNERNAYFSLPGGTNLIVLDIRNKKMTALSR